MLVVAPGVLLLHGHLESLPRPGLPWTDRYSLLTVASVFAGACAAGVAGFAFSAITGALLLHWMEPTTVVPLLLACSVTTQLVSIAGLRRSMQWRRCAPYLAGGLAGIPVGATVLRALDRRVFAVAFGTFLVLYSASMLLPPSGVLRAPSRLLDVVIGLGGGMLGGAIAFPGAIATIWCSLQGLPKDVQRGTIQPFILLMQLATLVYYSRIGLLARSLSWTYLLCAPAVIGGTWIGLRRFERIDDAAFRRIALLFLPASGMALAL
jgi:uncharacterized protein